MILSRVDFPAPLGPMSAVIEPSSTSSSALCTAYLRRRPGPRFRAPFACC
jgi:hypothetical protein